MAETVTQMTEASPLVANGFEHGAASGGAMPAFKSAVPSLLTLQAVVTLLMGLFTTYTPGSATGVGPKYGMMLDVSVMIFIGFGYLMTFLRKYGFGAVGFTLCLSAIAIELGTLSIGFWGCVHGSGNAFGVVCDLGHGSLGLPRFGIGVDMLVQGLFASAAVMISFGALIGKASFDQMVVVAVVETVCVASVVYGVNLFLYSSTIEAVDVGGSVVIHTFGAYFGLAATVFLTPRGPRRDFSDMTSRYTSDLFAFIGTVFLWIYWPSFNGVTASPELQERAVVNTMLALLSSCIVSFFCSRRFRGDGSFDAVDIQNATLAGGVAVGTGCTLPLEPCGASVVGALAGALSCVGYAFLLNRLEKRGVHDTCGVHNLHGMPGLLGGVVGVVVTAASSTHTVQEQSFPRGSAQWLSQLFGLVVTVVMAVVCGALTGALTARLVPLGNASCFTDEASWTVPTGEPIFTKHDTVKAVPRSPSMRQRRSAAQNAAVRAAVYESDLGISVNLVV